MLRPAILLGGLTLLACAAPASAASFDCAKAKARVEKVICADPQLSRLDEALATAYRAALRQWDGQIADYVKMTQRNWMSGRGLMPPGYGGGGIICDDDATRLTCLRNLYANRIAVLTSPGFPLGGIYLRGKDMLRVRPVPGGLDVSYAIDDPGAIGGFTDEAKPIAVKPGQTTLAMPLQGDGAQACRLDGVFTGTAVILTQHGPCSGNTLNGRWVRANDLDPDDESF